MSVFGFTTSMTAVELSIRRMISYFLPLSVLKVICGALVSPTRPDKCIVEFLIWVCVVSVFCIFRFILFDIFD